MTQQVIKDYWMTIGTDNKSVDIFTKNGRVKSGAKGIGRFALDKLGDCTEMVTIFDPKTIKKDDVESRTGNGGYFWSVKWSDFEGKFKTIDKVNAELIGIQNSNLSTQLLKIIDNQKIFEALYTTKRNMHTGEEEGTGLGMWLVKTISDDNDAKVKLLFPENGFGIRFLFPVKYKR